MIKVAVFCEGETETLFCKRLFDEIIGQRCEIQTEKLAGKHGSRFMRESAYGSREENCEYLIRLFDCGGGGEETVTSDMAELFENFINKHHYSFIIGVRDVYPVPRGRKDNLRENAERLIPMHPVPGSDATVVHVFSVMEIEAWFLAEHQHLAKIDPRLTPESIRAHFGFDPIADDMELRDRPARDLEQIHRLVNTRYHPRRTVALLQIDRMYLEISKRYPPLSRLIDTIESIYAAGTAGKPP